jgi:hypothetical protein
MTKSELVATVANRLSCLTRKDAEIIVDTMFDSMIEALAQGTEAIHGSVRIAWSFLAGDRQGLQDQGERRRSVLRNDL